VRPGKSKAFALIQPTLYASSALVLALIEIFGKDFQLSFTVRFLDAIIVFDLI
jgi:hypothetical protein